MKLRYLVLASVLTLAVACGNDDNNDNSANNTTPNNANNVNNVNNTTPNNVNNTTPNNVNNTTPNNVNNTTPNNVNNGNPLTCNGDFGQADACGGSPVGSWDLSEACTNYDYEAAIQGVCADAVVSDAVVNLTGTLTVDAATWSQDISGDITVTMSTATACGVGNCTVVQAGLGMLGTGACTDNGAGGCDCTATIDVASASAGTYTTDAGVATIGSGETYYYCVSGGTMLLREFGTAADDALPTFLLTAQ